MKSMGPLRRAALSLATLVLTVLMYLWIPKGLFPTQNTGQLQVRVEAEQSVSYPRMAQLQQEVALAAMSQWWNAWSAPWHALIGHSLIVPKAPPTASGKRLHGAMQRVLDETLKPIHRRATANARRLSRARKR